MRETCARVLAAALMTGAIATALGLPAAFDNTEDPGRHLTAPSSSLQRTVRVPAATAPERPTRAERLVTAHSSRPTVVGPRIVRQLSDHKGVPRTRTSRPPAEPAPEPETRELASTAPEARPAPAVSVAAPGPREEARVKKGKGHAKGKAKAQGASAAEAAGPSPSSTPPVPAPANPQGEPDEQKDHGNANANGHAKEKDKGQGDGKPD